MAHNYGMKIATNITTRCNFHLPMPVELYRQLRDEADRSGKPATLLARQAIEAWLEQRRKMARHQAIASFAAACAGTPADLDSDLEAISVEHLLKPGETP
jgi:hypothetical protein